MNRNHCLILATTALLLAAKSMQAQQSGIIEYEVTVKTDPERMRNFQRINDDTQEMPTLVTFKQTFTYNNGTGRLMSEYPGFGRSNRRPGADTSNPFPRSTGIAQRAPNALYVDLINKKYQQVFNSFSGDKKIYYTEEDYILNTANKLSDKTKKIAGYNCKKATILLKGDTYTVWYTTELPFSFSPVNGLLPDSNAVVLAATGSKRAFLAKNVTFKTILTTDLNIPAGAEKISQDQMIEIRKQVLEKRDKRSSQF